MDLPALHAEAQLWTAAGLTDASHQEHDTGSSSAWQAGEVTLGAVPREELSFRNVWKQPWRGAVLNLHVLQV